MDFDKLVLVTTTSGEKMIGSFQCERVEFDEDAKHGLAVVIHDVRNMMLQETQQRLDDGRVMMGMTINLMALPPFSSPVTRQNVRLSSWIHLKEENQIHKTISALYKQAERKEQEMRASAAGITLVPGAGSL